MNSTSRLALLDKAVIDIGSGSIRLMIFRTHANFFQPIFNEKVTASLGKGVRQTGLLNPKGVKTAKTAITRFMHIVKARGISDIYAVATAAVRDAKDGAAFLAMIKDSIGLSVRALDGPEEARLSALGVIAGEPLAEGLVADLGGSSLELASIIKGTPRHCNSQALGPLAIITDKGEPLSKMRERMDQVLSPALAKLKATKPMKLFIVGGAWRSLALVHMELRGYPLRILHNYRMSISEALSLTQLVINQSPASLAKVPGISSKRAAILPHAALLLERLLSLVTIDEVVVSAFGLREGLLFEALPPEAAKRHPVLTSVEAMAHQNWSSPEFGRAVETWLAAVFTHLKSPFDVERTQLLYKVVCQSADIGSRLHPDHRAEIAFDLILFAPFAGISHSERAALALAVFHRYAGPSAPPRVTMLMRLVGEDVRLWATVIGLGLRCAAAVSGRTPDLLARTQLKIVDNTIMLDAQDEESVLLTKIPGRRLADLANALGLKNKFLV